MTSHDIDRVPLIVRFDEAALYTETYGFAGSQGSVTLEGQRLLPRNKPADTVLLFMHPSSTLNLLPMPAALARAGLHVICCASRYAKNDSALIMEKVVIDLGAYIRHAKHELGYRNVVLVGWSGGGSLSLFYQAQAERPSITATPAGDPLDLSQAGLIPADATLFVAAHKSRAAILSEWIDPSVNDELHPDDRDPKLDIYHPDNPNQPPYASDFIERYRAAQLARNRKISAWVKATLDELKQRDNGEYERGFVVHRTMADPRWLDPNLEPSDRAPNRCYLGDPRAVNVGPVGLARFCTLRAWLSQWSIDDSRADGPASAAQASAPLLLIENSADDAVPPSHTQAVYQASASNDKTMHVVKGATHYYRDQPQQLAEAVSVCLRWLEQRGLA